MGLWDRLMGRSNQPGDEPGAEHALIITITFEEERPPAAEFDFWLGIQEQMERAIEDAGAGELDGDEWGEGVCTIYCYGPNADALWDAVAPVLEKTPIRKGSYAIKRYGGPGSGREERINLHWDG